MKAILAATLLVIATPAIAQEARPLPPDSFQYDGLGPRSFTPPTPPQTGLMTLPASPLPPGSFQFDDRRQELRPFGAPLPPAPKPAPKPGKASA
jgi:hypothetical protein